MWIPLIGQRNRDYSNKDKGDVSKGGDGRKDGGQRSGVNAHHGMAQCKM